MSITSIPASVRARIAVEARIVRSLIREVLAAGCAITVWDGENYAVSRSTSPSAIRAATMQTDEDQLIIHLPGEAGTEWVRLVYGNDGWDVMNDWTTTLDPLIPQTLALVESLS